MNEALVDLDAVVAVADLVARSGATDFEIGYLDDDPANPRWYATAFYKGGRLFADEKASPDEAADALARRILRGGQCTNCRKPVNVSKTQVSGRCGWWRDGPDWVRGCDNKRKATRD